MDRPVRSVLCRHSGVGLRGALAAYAPPSVCATGSDTEFSQRVDQTNKIGDFVRSS